MQFIIKCKPVFYLIQFTWGIIMNLIGLIVFLVLIPKHKHYTFGNSVITTVGKGWGGVSFGVFVLCGTDCLSHHLKCHESGHGIQNLFMGPLFPFLVGIPSAIRYWYRELHYYRKGKSPKTDYDSVWFEGQATKLGEKYYGELQ